MLLVETTAQGARRESAQQFPEQPREPLRRGFGYEWVGVLRAANGAVLPLILETPEAMSGKIITEPSEATFGPVNPEAYFSLDRLVGNLEEEVRAIHKVLLSWMMASGKPSSLVPQDSVSITSVSPGLQMVDVEVGFKGGWADLILYPDGWSCLEVGVDLP